MGYFTLLKSCVILSINFWKFLAYLNKYCSSRVLVALSRLVRLKEHSLKFVTEIPEKFNVSLFNHDQGFPNFV